METYTRSTTSQEDPMSAPNLFLVYVSDAQAATAFYGDLFDMEPVFTSPRYVAFEIAPGALFAVWTGGATVAVPSIPRTSEIGLMIPGAPADVDEMHGRWVARGVRIVRAPYDEVFGRTFVAADPDGNFIRVSPID